MCIYFYGSDYIEDFSVNLKEAFGYSPNINVSDPGRILDSLIELSVPVDWFVITRGDNVIYGFGITTKLHNLNLRIHKKPDRLNTGGLVINCNNSIICTRMKDEPAHLD